MKRKNSRSSMMTALGEYAIPPLVTLYQRASRAAGLGWVRVRRSDHPKFIRLQSRLTEHDIRHDTYAYTMVQSWAGWCKRKGMHNVPVGLFCGEKSWNRFTKGRATVRVDAPIDDLDACLLHDELTYARHYIGALIYDVAIFWRAPSYDNRPIQDALKLLCELYGIDNATSYDDVASTLQERLHR